MCEEGSTLGVEPGQDLSGEARKCLHALGMAGHDLPRVDIQITVNQDVAETAQAFDVREELFRDHTLVPKEAKALLVAFGIGAEVAGQDVVGHIEYDRGGGNQAALKDPTLTQ